jgi:TPP-dependent pyruvate/acetoin dehydrogenase alpha subunit
MASAWKLPVIFLCENNKYGVSVAIDRVTNIADLADRARAYGIPGLVVDGHDVVAVHQAVAAAAARARAGEGPTLVEAKNLPPPRPLRRRSAALQTRRRSRRLERTRPLVLLEKAILALTPGAAADLAAIDASVRREIEDAVAYAEQSPYPDPAEVLRDVYAADNERSVAR